MGTLGTRMRADLAADAEPRVASPQVRAQPGRRNAMPPKLSRNEDARDARSLAHLVKRGSDGSSLADRPSLGAIPRP